MMARSHLILGGVSWSGWCLMTGLELDPAGLGVAAASALLPDIDHPSSALGRRVPWLSRPISALFGHRGITHSALALIGVVVALAWLWRQDPAAGAIDLTALGLPTAPDPAVAWVLVQAVAVGYLSHLAGDWLTPSGIPLLWPWSRTFSLNLFRTGGLAETAAVILLALSATAVYVQADPARADQVRAFIERHADLPATLDRVLPDRPDQTFPIPVI